MSDQMIAVEAESVDAAPRRVVETAETFAVRRDEGVASTWRDEGVASTWRDEGAASTWRDEGVASTWRDEGVASTVSVPAQRLDSAIITVKTAARSAYAYCARAARRLRWSVTVKASAFAVTLKSRVRAFLKNVFPKTGADILRQSAILNM